MYDENPPAEGFAREYEIGGFASEPDLSNGRHHFGSNATVR